MTFPKARLAVSIVLLVSWLGFLLYLVIDSHRVILSRPQFLLAQAVVVIDVRDNKGEPDPDVTVDEVLFPPQAHMPKLRLPDLAECGKAQGYRGAGKYLVPLVKLPTGEFSLAPIPRARRRSVKALIRTLGSDSAEARQEAFLALQGRPEAMPVLREAAHSTDPVVAKQVVEILDYFKRQRISPQDGVRAFGPTHGTVETTGLFSHRIRRRLPLPEAYELMAEWEAAGYDVSLTEEELRIYPWTPDAQTQLMPLIDAKK